MCVYVIWTYRCGVSCVIDVCLCDMDKSVQYLLVLFVYMYCSLRQEVALRIAIKQVTFNRDVMVTEYVVL
jgi:hypothetical protein